MKKLRFIFAIVLSVILLSACGSKKNANENNTSNTQLTGQTNNNNYQSIIKNGHYLTSKTRGVNVQQDDNQLNLKSFENGLLRLSKKQFSPDKYILQEGQYISTDTAENWLDRESKSNPEGLNTASKKPDVPMYLQQIDEQDFLTQNGKSLDLSGMTIGLGINSVYYYQKEQYGSTYQKDLSDADIRAQGKQIAAKVLTRLRQNSKLKNIPIKIALYKQAPNDSLVGGNFFASTVSNSNSINKWNKINEKNYVFPIASGTEGPKNNNDQNDFSNFKSQVQNFFPNLSGITAQAHYINDTLSGLNIDINTQFYSQTEIISFTQYLKSAAQKYLPRGVPININVQSTEGEQSFLSRNTNSDNFYSHVFNSY